MHERNRSKARLYARGLVEAPPPWYDPGHWILAQGPVVHWTYKQDTMDYTEKVRYADTGFYPASNFHTSSVSWNLSGCGGYTGIFRYTDYLCDFSRDRVPSHIIPDGRDRGDSVYAVETLAKTNPYRTDWSTTVFIKELIDVTQLFSLAAKSFTEFVGNAYLSYRFGWIPFVQDIKTLNKLTTLIERRIKEFSSLAQKGGLRRHVLLDSYSGEFDSGPGFEFNTTWNLFIYGQYRTVTRTHVWGSVSWVPTTDWIIPLDGLTAFNLACRQVLDSEELDPATVWQMIPFSWLVDYFVKVNDSFIASEHPPEIQPRDVCIMRHYVTDENGTPDGTHSGTVVSGGGFAIRHESKDRSVVSSVPFPPVIRSFLTRNEFLILAALLAKFSR